MDNSSSLKFYATLAKDYAAYSKKRKYYNVAVDSLLQKYMLRKSFQRWLDVGTGDGRRALNILNKTKTVTHAVLIDSCAQMLLEAPKKIISKVQPTFKKHNIVKGKVPGNQFDIVTLLWNVVGHMNQSERLTAFRNIWESLSSEGYIFLDINNRLNAKAYGLMNAIRNALKGLLGGDKGDYPLKIGTAKTQVHLFTLREIRAELEASHFIIKETHFIDYATGQEVYSPWCGQIVILAQKAPEKHRSS